MTTPTLHAKISSDGLTVLTRQVKDADTLLDRATAEARGKPFWLPIAQRGPRPAFDSETHHAPQPTESIDATQVSEGWTVPVAKTQQELDAELDALVTAIDGNKSLIKGLARIVFKITRGDWAIPQPSLTLAQFKNQLKIGAQE